MFCGTLVGVAWLDVATAGGLRAGGPSGTLECREVTNALFAPGPPRFAVATSATVSAPGASGPFRVEGLGKEPRSTVNHARERDELEDLEGHTTLGLA